MRKKLIRYPEGQWFAVPLNVGGYALGIIVRGNYKTRGGLGYFFGPKYDHLPTKEDTFDKTADQAVLIKWFGDLGIVEGDWPLIQGGKPFVKAEWPVPRFRRVDAVRPDIVWIVEYDPDNSEIIDEPVRIVRSTIAETSNLPKDGIAGSGAIEIVLSKLLS